MDLSKEKQNNGELKEKMKKLHNSHANLMKENQSLKQNQIKAVGDRSKSYFNEVLSRVFTSAQIKSLEFPENKVHWKSEDFLRAQALKRISTEAYHHVQSIVGIPLPSLDELQKWESKTKNVSKTLRSL